MVAEFYLLKKLKNNDRILGQLSSNLLYKLTPIIG